MIPSSIMGCCSLAEFYIGCVYMLIIVTNKFYMACGSFILVNVLSRINLLLSLPVELGELSHLGTLDLHSNQVLMWMIYCCRSSLQVCLMGTYRNLYLASSKNISLIKEGICFKKELACNVRYSSLCKISSHANDLWDCVKTSIMGVLGIMKRQA